MVKMKAKDVPPDVYIREKLLIKHGATLRKLAQLVANSTGGNKTLYNHALGLAWELNDAIRNLPDDDGNLGWLQE